MLVQGFHCWSAPIRFMPLKTAWGVPAGLVSRSPLFQGSPVTNGLRLALEKMTFVFRR